jgi:hypothetical protein
LVAADTGVVVAVIGETERILDQARAGTPDPVRLKAPGSRKIVFIVRG